MKTVGNETIGTCNYDMLIADSSVPVSVVTVTIAATSSAAVELKKGSVLEVDEDGKCALFAETADTYAGYILAEDVTTSTSDDIVATAFETGKFVKDKLITAQSHPLTVSALKALRDGGIFVEKAMV